MKAAQQFVSKNEPRLRGFGIFDVDVTAELKLRFAGRMRDLCDALGYSPALARRASSLSDELQVQSSEIQDVLTGVSLPSWDVLVKLCALFGKNPGYWLDADAANFPAGTHLVHPYGAGSDIVLRLPSDDQIEAALDPNDWIYRVADEHMGYSVCAGDYLVQKPASPKTLAEITSGDLCLLTVSRKLQLRLCESSTQTHLVFEARPWLSDDEPVMLRKSISAATSHDAKDGPVVCVGTLVAAIRTSPNLRMATTAA